MPDPAVIDLPTSKATAPAPGNPASQPAPGPGQPAAQPDTTKSAAASDPAKVQPPGVSADELLKIAGFTTSPEAAREEMERKYTASSAEAKRLNEQMKAVAEHLGQEQKVKLKFAKDGKFLGLEPADDYSPDLPDLKVSFADLSAKEKEAFTENPEKAVNSLIERVLGQAKKAFTRVQPTARNVVEAPSVERQAAALDFVKNRKAMDGTALYADFAADEPVLKSLLNDPTIPEAVRDAYYKAPEIMAELFYQRLSLIKQQHSALTARQEAAKKQKEEEARKAADLGPTGTGKTIITGDARVDAPALRSAIVGSIQSGSK